MRICKSPGTTRRHVYKRQRDRGDGDARRWELVALRCGYADGSIPVVIPGQRRCVEGGVDGLHLPAPQRHRTPDAVAQSEREKGGEKFLRTSSVWNGKSWVLQE